MGEVQLGKVEQAYRELKAMVVDGRVCPGDQLVVRPLSDALRIGLTPVREALLRLSQEKLIIASVNKGFRVRLLSLHETRDLYEFALLIMREGMRRPQMKIELRAPSPEGDAYDCASTIEDAYCAIARASGNAEMLETIEHFVDRTRCLRLADCEHEGRRAELCREMTVLELALAKGASYSGVRALEAHVSSTLARMPEVVKEVLARAHGIHSQPGVLSRREAAISL